jgi:Arc/MetJ-type ribon-helix-helix transcriptional regulator
MGMTSVRLDDELNRDVQTAATREGVSVSEFVRAAVRERAERVLHGASVWERVQPILDELERADAAEQVPIHFANPIHEAYADALVEEHEQQQRGLCPDGV